MSTAKRPPSFWGSPEAKPPSPAPRVPRPNPLTPLLRERPVGLSPRAVGLAELGLLVTVGVLLLLFFRPSFLFSITTTTGGDTGAHIYVPWFLREELFPRGQLFGWSNGWFAGFPALQFYFPLVASFQALLSYVIPYEVAFKLGTVLGTFFLPVAILLMLRLMRFSFPIPMIGATFGLYFLFMDSFQIFGGNIAGSLAGEYSFSLSVALCFVFVGLFYRVVIEQRGSPTLTAFVLAAAVLSHLVPVIMAMAGALAIIVWAGTREGWFSATRRASITLGIAFALTAFWSIPFLARLPYTANMRWGSLVGWGTLLPRELWIFIGLAVVGAIVAAVRRDARTMIFAVPGAVAVLAYFLLPDGHVWNGRFVPFWYLAVLLMASYGLGTVIPSLARAVNRSRAGLLALVVTLAVAAGVGGNILREREPSYVDNWIADNYRGYEGKPDYPGFKALIDRLSELPPGRIMWEPNAALGKYGTAVALMSLPYWTEHSSMEGMYFESSFTTPFHFLTASEVAEAPSNPIPDLPYEPLDLDRGVPHMQLFDVSYYLTFTETARREALAHDDLDLVGNSGEFSIFEVDSSYQVVVPEFQPVVLEGRDWIDANIEWFSDLGSLDVPLASDGPAGWDRSSDVSDLPRTPQEDGGRVFPSEVDHDAISFETDAVGAPHWIKTSYFPNWRAQGALGPYIASPSLMLVIPTQERVSLTYERTWAEWTGLALSFLAVVLLIVPRTRRWASALALR